MTQNYYMLWEGLIIVIRSIVSLQTVLNLYIRNVAYFFYFAMSIVYKDLYIFLSLSLKQRPKQRPKQTIRFPFLITYHLSLMIYLPFYITPHISPISSHTFTISNSFSKWLMFSFYVCMSDLHSYLPHLTYVFVCQWHY